MSASKWCETHMSASKWHETYISAHQHDVKHAYLHINMMLKVIYHPLYSMNKFVTNKSKLQKDGGTSVSLYGVICYHVTL